MRKLLDQEDEVSVTILCSALFENYQGELESVSLIASPVRSHPVGAANRRWNMDRRQRDSSFDEFAVDSDAGNAPAMVHVDHSGGRLDGTRNSRGE